MATNDPFSVGITKLGLVEVVPLLGDLISGIKLQVYVT